MTRLIRLMGLGLVTGMLAMPVFATSAMAVSTPGTGLLDFGVIAPTAGTISYAGGTSSLIGTDINVDNVVGLGTSLNSGVELTCAKCVLNFVTEAYSGATTNQWSFSGGGMSSISITGDLFDGQQLIATGTLMTGTFSNAVVLNLGNSFNIAGANFADFKHDDLAAYYGFPTNLPSGAPYPWNGNFNISFAASALPGQAFVSTSVFSGDIVNQPSEAPRPTPEPSTFILLGSGLAGVALWRQRKARAA